jgi:hypothetical protein
MDEVTRVRNATLLALSSILMKLEDDGPPKRGEMAAIIRQLANQIRDDGPCDVQMLRDLSEILDGKPWPWTWTPQVIDGGKPDA